MAVVKKQNKDLLSIDPKSLTHKKDEQLRQDVIVAKKTVFENTIKCPPHINQFKTTLNEEQFKNIKEFVAPFKPETRNQRIERLKTDKKEGPKPILLKAGAKHVLRLIEVKKAKLVLIAADVNPIEIVLMFPTLCYKQNITYGIVKSQYALGELLGRKRAAIVGLCDIRDEDKVKFISIQNELDGIFKNKYSAIEWGIPENMMTKEQKLVAEAKKNN